MRRFLLLAAVTMTACSEEESVPRATSDATAETSSMSDTALPVDTAMSEAALAVDSGTADAVEDVAEVAIDGGTEADCIDATGMDAYFKLEDTTKCLVARYDVPVASLGSLTWGRHGGPLGF